MNALVIVIISVAVVLASIVNLFQQITIDELTEQNEIQETRIQELDDRVAEWEQLIGPRMDNVTATITNIDNTLERFKINQGCIIVEDVTWCAQDKS